MPPDTRWEDSVGLAPHKVWVGERADKKFVLYLRWRARGNWRWRSLGATLRDERGRVQKHIKDMALRAAEEQYELNTGKRAPTMLRAPLTLGETWLVVTDPMTGRYPHDTPHRREVARALTALVRILGPHTPWSIIEKARLRQYVRTRVDELTATGNAGYRGAEVAMQRVLAVAEWLREEAKIPTDCAHAGTKWRDELREYVAQKHGGTLPEPQRPRHTLADMKAILVAAQSMDPRFALLIQLGAELRLGQVARARRSHLNLEHWSLTIRGRGKKRGTVELLTDGQRDAVRWALTGYLAPLEERVLEYPDYPLFPAGQLPGGRKGFPVVDPTRHGNAASVTGTTIRGWFREAEVLAKVPHLHGRGAYGIRRVAVDGVKALGISREGLQQHGGWSDTQIPDRIYADQDALAAREEAREKRATLRGETE